LNGGTVNGTATILDSSLTGSTVNGNARVTRSEIVHSTLNGRPVVEVFHRDKLDRQWKGFYCWAPT
jgi:hypothetical protein